MKKKIIGITFIAVLSMTVFSGCKKNDENIGVVSVSDPVLSISSVDEVIPEPDSVVSFSAEDKTPVISNDDEESNRTVEINAGDDRLYYADKQGTDVEYSTLLMEKDGEGVYKTSISLYRLTTLEGTSTKYDDMYLFEDSIMGIKGIISFNNDGASAVFEVTKSNWELISSGEVFDFPDVP